MNNYYICKRCVMDKSDPLIIFNEEGCNHCNNAIKLLDKLNKDTEKDIKLHRLISEIKEKGKDKEYDCVIGISGGVDSSYVAYLVKKNGLRPLAVHLDNGWNSELSIKNIERVIKKLDIDLYTYFLKWDEFKSLQLSFLKASVPHCEHPTDHAITSILYKIANDRGIKYIILGSNISTESISVKSWSGGQRDWKYIKNIHKQFEKTSLKDYPHITPYKLLYYSKIKKIKSISILNYVDYKKESVLDFLKSEFNWEYYGGKHYESLFTKFFQTFILPKKFGIDKRKSHFSSLICNGEMTRDEALLELKKEICSETEYSFDKENFIKKLGLEQEEFDKILNKPVKSFYDYPSYEKSWYYKIFYSLFKREIKL